MSYDIGIFVKVEGIDKYAMIAEPKYSSPTYNLGQMFRACMGWDYSQSEKDENGEYQTCYYNCSDIIGNVERGIRELRTKPDRYRKYEPENGWGTISSAVNALESLRDCIYEQAEDIPLEHLYMAW